MRFLPFLFTIACAPAMLKYEDTGYDATTDPWETDPWNTNPGGVPSGTPAGTPGGTPSGTAPGVPAGTPAGTPVGVPSGTPAGTDTGTPVGVPGGTPVGGAMIDILVVASDASFNQTRDFWRNDFSAVAPQIYADIAASGNDVEITFSRATEAELNFYQYIQPYEIFPAQDAATMQAIITTDYAFYGNAYFDTANFAMNMQPVPWGRPGSHKVVVAIGFEGDGSGSTMAPDIDIYAVVQMVAGQCGYPYTGMTTVDNAEASPNGFAVDICTGQAAILAVMSAAINTVP